MINYKIPMTAGPVKLSPFALPMLNADFGVGFMEDEFYELYNSVGSKLQSFIGTKNEVVIQSGEAMAVLWGALKSTIQPGDKVLCISSGYFGDGFADMANSLHAETKILRYANNETIHDPQRIEDAIQSFQPKVITAVHCETPSGTLNPLIELGEIKRRNNVPLLIVDAVSSLTCAPLDADANAIDIVLGGTQKGLSLPPNGCFCSVSEKAWEIIQHVQYAGYEALLPWRDLFHTREHPNTPDWNGIAAMNAVLNALLDEGVENVFARHQNAAQLCRESLVNLGYQLYPKADAICSPSVTAVKVPQGITFNEFNQRVRAYGMGISGSFGEIEGHVFRLGHMGSQATIENVQAAMDVLSKVK